VNIVDPGLKVEGTLTARDHEYLEAMGRDGPRRVMLSYVEGPSDPEEVQRLLPGAEVVLKIENERGLAFARDHGATHGRLCAGRGDLYVEVGRPHRIVGALRTVIEADPEAIVASRLFDSLADDPIPSAADIGDAAFLLGLGYRTFLLGDAVCLRRDSVLAALNVLAAVAGEMDLER
jgi:pyruvate kinase